MLSPRAPWIVSPLGKWVIGTKTNVSAIWLISASSTSGTLTCKDEKMMDFHSWPYTGKGTSNSCWVYLSITAKSCRSLLCSTHCVWFCVSFSLRSSSLLCQTGLMLKYSPGSQLFCFFVLAEVLLVTWLKWKCLSGNKVQVKVI